MRRRNFFGNIVLGLAVSCLSTVIAACSNNTSSTSNSSVPNHNTQSGGFSKAGTVQELDQKGYLLLKDNNTNALIVRNPQSPESLNAVHSVCTHQGCPMDWSVDSKELVCACHGSTFKGDGTVTKGPASQPLDRYEAKIEGNDVLIKLS